MDLFQSTAATQWVEQNHQSALRQADLDRRLLDETPPDIRGADLQAPPALFAAAIILVLATLLLASVAI